MSEKRLNPKILRSLNKNCQDENLITFLSTLLGIEADHPGQWWWKETYSKELEKFTKGEKNE